MSFFSSIGKALSRVWNAPQVKEARHDLEIAARAAVQREINELIIRNMGGPMSEALLRALIGIDKLADSDPVAAAVQLAELKAQLNGGNIPHG